ncbi:hypothetical protein RirG_266160 [Rhizophagus irregularis DAOM 197198w]|uniref:Uncharacterized protein n=1 Tax=Rhizophagus irregularis (strain DAOM 197198w) TaxID=1432141 RepID=A0A015J7T0_RHIIW|nr:hypothetical protein RirG_266160 [Rhizophagus irregularis DAOM 197198w]
MAHALDFYFHKIITILFIIDVNSKTFDTTSCQEASDAHGPTKESSIELAK